MERPLPEQLDAQRRRAYGVAALVLSVLTFSYSVRDVLQSNWSNFPSSVGSFVVCAGVLLALHIWKVSTERLNSALSVALFVAALPEFLPFFWKEQVGFTQHLSYLLITALWFGLLPMRVAAAATGAAFMAFAALVLSRPVHDLSLLTYLGGVTLVVGMVASFGQEVNLKRLQAAKYQEEAHTDALTGLFNRRAVMQHLERLWPDPLAGQGSTFALFMIDLDHFKAVNDQYGHTVGDQVLEQVGVALRRMTEPDVLLCRWGGEEFMLVLPDTTAQHAYATGVRLHGQTLPLPAHLPSVTISAGAVLSHETQSLAGLLMLADQRLHAAKESGRNQVKWNTHLDAPNPTLPASKSA